MKKQYLILALLVCLACGDDTETATATDEPGGPSEPVNGEQGCATLTDEARWSNLATIIDEDTTLGCDRVHVLTGLTFIVNGATLTIEAGTTVLGGEATALVATTEGRLVTNGTQQAPVVLTSINAVSPNPRSAGDWGGVVLLGNAPINVEGGSNLIEGIDTSNPNVPENGSRYGGDDASYDCGSLRYTRIEFAGFELTEGNELNGLTLGGCGSATTIDYLQVHEGLDDGVEIFGGAPNLKHIVLSHIEDDSLDWDQGFTGNIQYLFVVQKDSDADNGIEADNAEDAHDAEPRSNPTIANMTLIGSVAGSHGIVLRRGTYATIVNSIVTGFPKFGLDIRDEASALGVSNGDTIVENCLFFANGNEGAEDDLAGVEEGEDDDDNALNESEVLAVDGLGNVVGVDPNLDDFKPAIDGPAANSNMVELNGFFDQTMYKGAFDPAGDEWTKDWTTFATE